jgi:hypothetical protein
MTPMLRHVRDAGARGIQYLADSRARRRRSDWGSITDSHIPLVHDTSGVGHPVTLRGKVESSPPRIQRDMRMGSEHARRDHHAWK